MEYKGMPLNWCDYYYKGFEQVKDTYGLELSEMELQESVEILKSYNPRISGRELEIAPEIIFRESVANWKNKPNIENVIDVFFKGLNLSAEVFDFSIALLQKCKSQGCKMACLTDLPNGMPDSMFKKAIAEIIDLFDLYVSSQSCGVRKPNKEGLILIARTFGVDVSELLFIGDEEKDYMTALNAGSNFMFISDFINLLYKENIPKTNRWNSFMQAIDMFSAEKSGRKEKRGG